MSKENEQLQYLVKEVDVKKRSAKVCPFPTFFFDETLKIEVFQKDSNLKTNSIGKGLIELRDLAYSEIPGQPSIIGVPIVYKNSSIG